MGTSIYAKYAVLVANVNDNVIIKFETSQIK